jgi:hypothetical protein
VDGLDNEHSIYKLEDDVLDLGAGIYSEEAYLDIIHYGTLEGPATPTPTITPTPGLTLTGDGESPRIIFNATMDGEATFATEIYQSWDDNFQIVNTYGTGVAVSGGPFQAAGGFVMPAGTSPAPSTNGSLFLDTDNGTNGSLSIYSNGGWRTIPLASATPTSTPTPAITPTPTPGDVIVHGDLKPVTNDSYYLGGDAPMGWKGLYLIDQANGTLYLLDIYGGAVRLREI